MTAPTIYFIGGELESVAYGSDSSIYWDTSSGVFDADFARGAVSLNTTNSAIYINVPLTSSQTTCWASYQLWRQHANVNNDGNTFSTWQSFVNSNGVALFRVQGVGGISSQPLVAFQYWNGSAWTTLGTPLVVTTNARHKWDYYFNLAGSGGDVRCYVDGMLLGQLTGNTAPVSPANIAAGHIFSTGSGGLPLWVSFSEGQILDVSTLGRRLATLGETANGANTDFTGAYTDINETGTYNDSNFIYSGTANQVSTFVTTDLSAVAQTYNVSGIAIAGRILIGATGPQNLQGAVRIGGTNYFSSNVSNLLTQFGYTWAFFAQSPATSAAFTPTEINTAGFETGWKSIT